MNGLRENLMRNIHELMGVGGRMMDSIYAAGDLVEHHYYSFHGDWKFLVVIPVMDNVNIYTNVVASIL